MCKTGGLIVPVTGKSFCNSLFVFVPNSVQVECGMFLFNIFEFQHITQHSVVQCLEDDIQQNETATFFSCFIHRFYHLQGLLLSNEATVYYL